MDGIVYSSHGHEYLVVMEGEFLIGDFNWTGGSYMMSSYEGVLDNIWKIESPLSRIQNHWEPFECRLRRFTVSSVNDISRIGAYSRNSKNEVIGYCPRMDCEIELSCQRDPLMHRV
jgi:hypothetical protein